MAQILDLPRFIATVRAVVLTPFTFTRSQYALQKDREFSLWTIHARKEGDPYLAPLAFAALAIVVGNLLFWIGLPLGREVGAYGRDFVEFAEWADAQGYLGGVEITGIEVLDSSLGDLLIAATAFVLGSVVFLASGRRIPIVFAASHIFYWQAWSLVSSAATFVMIVLAMAVPIYETPVPGLVGGVFYLIGAFMLLAFPVVAWPALTHVSRLRTAVAYGLGFVAWVAAAVAVGSLLRPVPGF